MSEEEICGEVEIHGGEYEWVCVLPPHGETVTYVSQGSPRRKIASHYFKAFKKIA